MTGKVDYSIKSAVKLQELVSKRHNRAKIISFFGLLDMFLSFQNAHILKLG